MSKDGIHALARGVIIDEDHILLCKTQDLPHNFYFLPGGHIEHRESAIFALVRELEEEAGAKDIRIKRFLGCLEHVFEPRSNSICHTHEYNFIFELESDFLKYPTNPDQKEDHIKLMWVPLKELESEDFRPKALKKILQKWITSHADGVFESFHDLPNLKNI
ncbi:MAG: hypothetical protein HEEMFOPI_00297 [Holosporales bacterium]